MIPDETSYRLLKQLEANPNISQRELSRTLGMSLGKVNYCLKALIRQGLVKSTTLDSGRARRVCAYPLTPAGLRSKGEIALAFLRRKQGEYEQLGREIEELSREVRGQEGKLD